MKSIISIIFLLIICQHLGAQIVPTTCEAPDSVKAKYDYDAKVLAVEAMQTSTWKDSILIPQSLIDAKMRLFLGVYNGFGLPARDTVIECLDIHFDSIAHTLQHVQVEADTSTGWIKNWIAGIFPTGNPGVDFLISTYSLQLQAHSSALGKFILLVKAGFDLNNPALARHFAEAEGVTWTTHGYAFCWGCDEIYLEGSIIDTFILLTYMRCWGDDCGYRRFYEFHLPLGCEKLHFARSYGDVLEEACFVSATSPVFLEKFEASPTITNHSVRTKILSNERAGATLRLLSSNGQVAYEQSLSLQAGVETETEIETSHLPAGLYCLVLILENQSFTKKIIVHR
jgi:hypothetical protein